MPPKAKKAARTDADSTTDWSSVSIELRGGEKDPQNVAYHAAVLDAWQIMQGHPEFDSIDTQDRCDPGVEAISHRHTRTCRQM